MKMTLSFITLLVLCLPELIFAHSWMTCPPSFNAMIGRGGIQGAAQCEGEFGSIPVTEVEAGDRLKVGWVSNNHGGGFARIALVPWNERKNAQSYKNNVMKFACYGHDERPGRYGSGDCKHPCNGRPGCEYQSDPSDFERYDTTIGIPTNLKDGFYSLQASMIVGNGGVYNSCAKLKVTGGSPSFTCSSSKTPVSYNCRTALSKDISPIKSGTKRGNFCYGLDGKVGTVDDYMTDVPINVDCDRRASCSQSTARSRCQSEFPSMLKIITSSSNPRQPNCPVYKVLPNL
uniref:Uncharacterized protein n=1 Tax=Clytia hemisphaerica TaxID=252671 RepID=A0A7M6DPJ0_9CNID